MVLNLRPPWRRVLRGLIYSAVAMFCATASTQTTFEDLFAIAKSLNEDAIASQAKIDELDDQRSNALHQYRTTLKTIDGQKVYNRQIQLIVNKQNDQIATLKRSIEEVTSIQRGIIPLMHRMIEGLDQFVSLDVPFFMDQRLDRLEELRDLMDNPNVSVSEKFAQVLRAYQIESEYGRTIDAYSSEIDLGGATRVVDILRVGRVALLFQTLDGNETGWLNPKTREWETLEDRFTIPTRNGLKMARKQLTNGLFNIPIYAPEG